MTIITIFDGLAHMQQDVELRRDQLIALADGDAWVLETLYRNGFTAVEADEDRTIEDAVYSAWSGGYEGDPRENGLTVNVRRSDS